MAKTIYTVMIDHNSYTGENLEQALYNERMSMASLYVAVIRSVWKGGESYEATTIGYGVRIGGQSRVAMRLSAKATEEERNVIEEWVHATKWEV